MRVGSLASFAREALHDQRATPKTPVSLVLRDPEQPLDNQDCWLEAPFGCVERDGDEIDLVPAEDDQDASTLGELIAALAPLAESDPELLVYLQGPTEELDDGTGVRIDTPALAFRATAEEDDAVIVGVFDGWEQVFGEDAG